MADTHLHPRNRHQGHYHFPDLIRSLPALAPFVHRNQFDTETIDFSNPEAVMLLNKALLKKEYDIREWSIPPGYLCPPIPGRADYIHYMADLLAESNNGIIPTGSKIRCLDIGVGANCIYPIIGNKEYGWSFVATDVEKEALQSAAKIIAANKSLEGKVELRWQKNANDIFKGVVQPGERFDLTICNPPFHASWQEAQAGTLRKLSNLNHKRITKPTLNFGGKNRELWCEGGEQEFIRKMILQSRLVAKQCHWFSTLVAKSAHLKNIYATLQKAGVKEVKTISMHQGNKISRIVAWRWSLS
jgi:23S rRNA (adenine1618-N6)-methyltransferase